MSELQADLDKHQNSEPGSCAVWVSVIPTNKRLLQELNQSGGIKLLTSGFLEIFDSYKQWCV